MIHLRLQLCLRQCSQPFVIQGPVKELNIKRTNSIPASQTLKIIYKFNVYSMCRHLYSRSKNKRSLCSYKEVTSLYVTVNYNLFMKDTWNQTYRFCKNPLPSCFRPMQGSSTKFCDLSLAYQKAKQVTPQQKQTKQLITKRYSKRC